MYFSYFKRNFENILAILLALVFFIFSSFIISQVQDRNEVKFLSPDETANYFFAKNYAENSEIAVFEVANLYGEEIVRPRSVRSDYGWLKPVSFLGIIILYGKIAAIFGSAVIPYLSPFFASLGIIFFYFFVRQIFDRQTAVISAVLLFSFPVYFFYTVRSMFHNVLFLVFLMGGALFLVLSAPKLKREKKKFFYLKLNKEQVLTYVFSLLTGLFFGLAVGARSSELLWLAPSLFLLWLFYIRRLGLVRLVIMLFGFIMALLPIFYWNQVLYSSPFYGGYSEMNTSIQQLSKAGENIISTNFLKNSFSQYQEIFTVLKDNIFYFGYHPYQSIRMFYYYVPVMFPYLCIMTFFGLIIYLFKFFKKPNKAQVAYFLTWLLLSFILVIYYGSWKFNDNPDSSRFTIGNSYTRYWLPMYVLAIPLASLFIFHLGKFFSKTVSLKVKTAVGLRLRTMIYALVVLVLTGACLFINILFLFFGSEEGLITLYYNHFQDQANAANVLKHTEDNAIIITQYHDKQFFPERKIISALLTDNQINLVFANLVNRYPLYYYNFSFPERDFNYLNEKKLAEAGLQLELVLNNGNFSLYRLKPVEVIDLVIESNNLK